MTWHLTVDAGNSQLALVLYHGEGRVDGLRIRTHPYPKVSQIVESLCHVLQGEDLDPTAVQLTISSVVPPLEDNLREAAEAFRPKFFHWVCWDSPHGFTASKSASSEIGSDLISGLVGARVYGQEAFVVVDCGTATTLTLLDQKDHILGVAIFPGLETQLLSLTNSAPHLPKEISLRPPELPYGNDTEEALQSGILYGHAAAVEGLAQRYGDIVAPAPLRAVGCGGLYHRIASLCPSVEIEEAELVNIGCRVLGGRARAGGAPNTVEAQRTFRP